MRSTSAAQKQAYGTYRQDRARKTPKFEGNGSIAAKPPAFIKQNKLAIKEWKAVAPFLESEGILKLPDIALFASYCTLYARWREAAEHVENEGQIVTVTSTTRTGRTDKPQLNPWVRAEIHYQSAMLKAAVKFGLNPLDRPRIVSPFDQEREITDDNDDDFEVIDTRQQ